MWGQERLKGESAADKTQIGELKAAHQEARQAVRAPDQTPSGRGRGGGRRK